MPLVEYVVTASGPKAGTAFAPDGPITLEFIMEATKPGPRPTETKRRVIERRTKASAAELLSKRKTSELKGLARNRGPASMTPEPLIRLRTMLERETPADPFGALEPFAPGLASRANDRLSWLRLTDVSPLRLTGLRQAERLPEGQGYAIGFGQHLRVGEGSFP